MKLLLSFFLLISAAAIAQVKKGKLIWEENFDGKELNESVWNYELGNGCPDNCGFGNAEKQIYTKINHKVANGFLTITTKKEGDAYTSTRITTKNKKEFKYGYMESRLKLPVGKGIWPAFWMLGANIDNVGWPLCGEIDIMEYVGREPHMAYATLHTKETHGEHANGKKTEFSNLEQGFHIFGVDWKKDIITFYVDGKPVHTFAPKVKAQEIWPYDQSFFFILNVAVGGYFGGMEVDDSIFPQEYIVDYIKVYSN